MLRDRTGADRRQARLPRVGHGLKRLIVVGSDGMVSLAALRWLADQDAAFVMLERDGSVLATTGPVRSSDARLRRAQALAQQSGAERFLNGAKRWGEWLAGVAIRDDHGLYWPWSAGTDDEPWYGLSFIPGASGTGQPWSCMDISSWGRFQAPSVRAFAIPCSPRVARQPQMSHYEHDEQH